MAQPQEPIEIQPINPDDPGDPGDPNNPPPYTPAGVPGTALFEFNFNKHEPGSVLKVLAYASVQSSDDLQFTGYVAIDGQIYQQTRVNLVLDNRNSAGAMPVTLPAFVSGIGAGNHTITFAIRNLEPDGPLTVLAGSTIEVMELKQAAL